MRTARASDLSMVGRLSDFPLLDAVYVGTVRSPVSRGAIRSISVPHLPRGYRSVTADDIPGSARIDSIGASVPVLASGRVAYRGEPVALIVGPDRLRVAEAVSMTAVRVDEEPASFGYEACESRRLVAAYSTDSGSVDAALAKAARVVDGEYRMGPQDHYYPEPQGAAAGFDYDKLIVFSSTQWPFQARDAVAQALGVRKDEVVVRTTSLGSHLDGKLWYPSLLACHAAIAARLSGKNALLLLSRTDDFMYTTKRAPTLVSYRAGLDEAGKLVAMDASVMINVGAYAPFGAELVERAAKAVAGAYACPSLRVAARAVSTDLPPMGAFMGLGTGPVAFAVERLAEDLADAAGMDPYEWRAMNVARRGDQTLGPPLRKGAPLDAVCDRLLAISDYPRKRSSFELIRKRRPDPSSPPGYGIGLAFGPQRPATALSCRDAQAPSVEVTLSKDSTLTIRSSVASGSGAVTRIWKRIAATSLGLSPEAVEVATPSTDEVPDSGPNVFSRRIGVVTRLIGSACDGLASKRFREALPITVRKSQRARSAKAAPESPLDDASWGAAVVELELDPVDAAPTVRGIWLVAKAGRILSREDAAAALERDAAVALGLCVAECLDLSAGPADPGDLRRYGLWRIKDAPPIQVEFVDDDAEPKGIGELAYSLVPAAFANALSQALDSPWNALPTCRRSEGVDDDS